MPFFLFLVYGVVCGAFCYYLAKVKGYSSSTTQWFLAGLFLGIFALIAAAGLPMNKSISEECAKSCPDCAESIKLAANICKYCGCKFSSQGIISACGKHIENNRSCTEALDIIGRFNDESAIPYLEKVLSYPGYDYHSGQDMRDRAVRALMKIGTIPALMVVLKLGDDKQKLEVTKTLKDILANRSQTLSTSDVVNITSALVDIIKGNLTPTAKICSAAILRDINDESVNSMVITYLEDAKKNRKLDKNTYDSILSKFRPDAT